MNARDDSSRAISQPSPLLATKLYIPPARPDPSTGLRTSLVPRPRLTERLNEGLERKLTLISVPAGFGKTASPAPIYPRRCEAA